MVSWDKVTYGPACACVEGDTRKAYVHSLPPSRTTTNQLQTKKCNKLKIELKIVYGSKCCDGGGGGDGLLSVCLLPIPFPSIICDLISLLQPPNNQMATTRTDEQDY